jgi:serine protease Do
MENNPWQQSAIRLFASAALMLAMVSCGLTQRLQPDVQPAPAAPTPDTASGGSQAGPAATPALLPSTGNQTPQPASSAQPASPAGANQSAPEGTQSGAPQGQAVPGLLATGVRDIAQHVRPAIVQITNQQMQFDQANQPFAVPSGVGSGVIYDNQGHILTNNHVIEAAQQLLVTLPDGRAFPAKLSGADPQTDLAVIQISANNLPVAQLGDSQQLQVGDWVVAIGNALALPGGPTVTVGVVSALGRTVQEPGSNNTSTGPFLFDVIQTSAPINPGNSGGALVNLQGQVIGINTLVAGQAEPGVQAQGIGFAISTAAAKPIADELVTNGRVVHASIGITYVPLNPAVAAQIGTSQTQGVVIVRPVTGGPAAQAGLRRGDVITNIDNTQLKEESDLARAIAQHKPGDKVTLSVVRGNQKVQIPVTLGEAQSP